MKDYGVPLNGLKRGENKLLLRYYMTYTKTIMAIFVLLLIVGGVWYVFDLKNNAISTISSGTPSPSEETIEAGYKKYVSANSDFSVEYPENYTVNDRYVYMALGPEKDISGVAFIIPEALMTGTNLSRGSYMSIEKRVVEKDCKAADFLSVAQTQNDVIENGRNYNVATSQDAGAGNYYEETVFASADGTNCYGMRLFLHTTAVGNYEPGTIKEFDRQQFVIFTHYGSRQLRARNN